MRCHYRSQRLTGAEVVETLNRSRLQRAVPQRLFCDNGSEFTSQVLDLWAYHHGVAIEFSRPGKPTDNAFIESFNGTLRDECLNTHWFTMLEDARAKSRRLAGRIQCESSSQSAGGDLASRVRTSFRDLESETKEKGAGD